MNTKELLTEHRVWVRDQLDKSVNFWLKHGMDPVNGGVYTCLDREGKVFSTDKSVWMQGRCAWTFAYLCHVYGAKEEWLQASKSCLDFMERYCINRQAGDRMYFTVTGDGKPLRQRRYCFSEGFYAIANGEYYGVTAADGIVVEVNPVQLPDDGAVGRTPCDDAPVSLLGTQRHCLETVLTAVAVIVIVETLEHHRSAGDGGHLLSMSRWMDCQQREDCGRGVDERCFHDVCGF